MSRKRGQAGQARAGKGPFARVEGCGLVELFLQVEHGRLTGVAFRGDFFSAEEPEELVRFLTGCPLERQALLRHLAETEVEEYFHGLTAGGLTELLLSTF